MTQSEIDRVLRRASIGTIVSVSYSRHGLQYEGRVQSRTLTSDGRPAEVCFEDGTYLARILVEEQPGDGGGWCISSGGFWRVSEVAILD